MIMAKLIDGKAISAQIKEECKEKVAKMKADGIEVTLAVIQVGNDPASTVYVGNKKKACEYIGIRSLAYELPEETTQEELLKLIGELNERKDVNGILVQLPLPGHIDEEKVLDAIHPSKDVDGFHPQNVGALCIGKPGFVSCTPAGIIQLLKRSDIEIAGKECVVIGRSNIVGKPMALLLLQKEYNATVTVCHTGTNDLASFTRTADILIVASGHINTVTKDMVKPGATVIDVGVNRIPDSTKKSGFRLCGDVDFEGVKEVAGYITPVPRGVGPMTIAMLIYNTLEAAETLHESV